MADEHADSEQVGKNFFVNIEGQEYPWHSDTITTQEIRTLGHLPADVPVIQEAPDGTERTLAENEAVTLQPGHRHGRAPRYKRG